MEYGGKDLCKRWVLSLDSGVKGRGNDRWWERRWWLWWGDMHRMRWTRRSVNRMRLTEWKKGDSSYSRGSKQKNCAHFEESMKLCMDKLQDILNKFRGGHKWNCYFKGAGIIFSKWPLWYQKNFVSTQCCLSLLYINVSKQMKTGYNKLSLSYKYNDHGEIIHFRIF